MWLYFPTLLGDGGAHPRVETARRQVIYSAHPDAMIYATLDGSQPGPEVGGVFDRRRLVVRVPDATMTVRAVCVANGRCPPPPPPLRRPCCARPGARAAVRGRIAEGSPLAVSHARVGARTQAIFSRGRMAGESGVGYRILNQPRLSSPKRQGQETPTASQGRLASRQV